MFVLVPDDLPPGAPLVVALHGCTQSAAGFDDESGWAGLAKRYGFALLLPEQRSENNRSLCFNFFLLGDNRHGEGETASIASMMDWLQAEHDLDRERAFVTGLSAGGAMTAVMLAAYPDRFVGGAIIAGVPYGCASTKGHPMLAMQRRWFLATTPYGEAGWASYLCGIDRTGVLRPTPFPREAAEWRSLALGAGGSPKGVWPKVSLWQSRDDGTVHPDNLRELIEQWTALHGADAVADRSESTSLYNRRTFDNAIGEPVIEAWEMRGIGHALPVNPGEGPDTCGVAEPYFEDVDLCAALQIARFWGIAPLP
jgi:poly(3-hydroxybutyrate) depolymerase